MKNYSIELKIKNPVPEAFQAVMFKFNCSGISENGESVSFYFSANSWQENEKIVLETVQRFFPKRNVNDFLITRIPDQNWNESWKKYFKPFKIGENIIIKPSWERYKAKPEEIILTINPKMAFGTGHHETTKLLLEMLEKLDLSEKSILDAGCGSGILAIFCALKGAEGIIAFDNDPEALNNALENEQINGLQNRINWQCAVLNQIDKRIFNYILANINYSVLLEIAADLKNYADENTLLMLSGLLISDEKKILKIYKENGWQCLEKIQRGEWLALKMRRFTG